jgi:hypothetical protein
VIIVGGGIVLGIARIALAFSSCPSTNTVTTPSAESSPASTAVNYGPPFDKDGNYTDAYKVPLVNGAYVHRLGFGKVSNPYADEDADPHKEWDDGWDNYTSIWTDPHADGAKALSMGLPSTANP